MTGAAASRTTPLRVLLADDAETLRTLLAQAIDVDPRLEVVGQASDGRETLALVATLNPDVLLLDISMPLLDGIGVLAELATQRRDLPVVVVLTGYGEADLGKRCRDLGARSFVEKGTSIGQLCDTLVEAGAPS